MSTRKLYDYEVSASCHGVKMSPCTRHFAGLDEADARSQAEATFPKGSKWVVVAVEKRGEASPELIAQTAAHAGETGPIIGDDDVFSAIFGDALTTAGR